MNLSPNQEIGGSRLWRGAVKNLFFNIPNQPSIKLHEALHEVFMKLLEATSGANPAGTDSNRDVPPPPLSPPAMERAAEVH